MARSHAKVLVQVWRDPEWTALPTGAQWLYVVLLSQPKLTLIGSLDIALARWATFAPDQTKDTVATSLEVLEAAHKVLVDATTDELLIRSFTKNDLDPNRLNVNLVKGLWGQWAAIESADLRSAALRHMPEDVWTKVERHAPSDAAQIRRSAQLEPCVRTGRSNHAIELPSSSHLPTDASHPPAEAAPPPPPVDKSTPLHDRIRAIETSPPRFGAPHLAAVPDASEAS